MSRWYDENLQESLPELFSVLSSIGSPKILVVGDLMLDRYTWGDAERISPEAPVIVLQAERDEERLGGAAAVAQFLKALGASVSCAGIVGADLVGEAIRRLISTAGIDGESVFNDPSRPTTIKERFVGKAAGRHPHQILRVDREVRRQLSVDVEEQLTSTILKKLDNFQALLISDYGKGACTAGLCRRLIEGAQTLRIPVLIDPPQNRDYRHYKGATAITPNRREAGTITGLQITTAESALQAGRMLRDNLDLQMAIIKLDEDGIALIGDEHATRVLSTKSRSVYDVTGAGDMVLAMLGLAIAERLPAVTAVELANLAAGLEVERFGSSPIWRHEILHQLSQTTSTYRESFVAPEDIAGVVASHRSNGRSIVFANGCFDMLHAGHLQYLTEAAEMGDVLIVGVNNDDSVRRLKGPDRPFVPAEARAAMLATIKGVDYVVVFPEDTPEALLRAIRPEILVKGGTYSIEEVVGRAFVEGYGGRVCVTSRVDGISTTKLLEQLRSHLSARDFLVEEANAESVRPPLKVGV